MEVLVPNRFSTKALPAQQQFDAWCSWFGGVFDVDPPEGGPSQGFEAESAFWSLEGMAISRVCAPPIRVTRTPQMIRREPLDHWSMILGQQDTHLGDSALRIPARTPFVVSMGRELISQRAADERLQFYLPRDRFASLAPALDAVQGVIPTHALSHLLADYLRLLANSVPQLTPQEASRLPDAAMMMISACLNPATQSLGHARLQLDMTRMERVRQMIRRNLRSARLGPTMICAELGMSRSSLYRLLDGDGGVMRLIQTLRLEACYTALRDPSHKPSIAQTAEACGFYDPSAFSRAFRRQFGMTPSELREMGSLTPAIPPRPRDEATATPTLRDCLRML